MVDKVKTHFSHSSITHIKFRDEDTLIVHLEDLYKVLTYCKESLGYDFLIDICSVDHGQVDPRFEIVYHLSTIDNSSILRIKSPISEDEEVESVVKLWKTADWHEREVWDMMGISFNNHPNLKRILMWEGYPYHPLRKEFPLAGKPTEMPDVAFSEVAPMEGGPFVTSSSSTDRISAEPRAKAES